TSEDQPGYTGRTRRCNYVRAVAGEGRVSEVDADVDQVQLQGRFRRLWQPAASLLQQGLHDGGCPGQRVHVRTFKALLVDAKIVQILPAYPVPVALFMGFHRLQQFTGHTSVM